MESMRATWTDTRLDEFAASVDRRFDRVDHRFDRVDQSLDEVNRRLEKVDMDVRDMKHEISANSRSMLQFCGVIVAAQMATVATLIALFS
jgi:DNA anti-recombination protein RmuC